MTIAGNINALQVKSELKEFIINTFLLGAGFSDLDDSDSFLEKGIIDSTGILELVEFIESKYEFKIEDDELMPENLDSVNNLVAFIQRKLMD